MFFSLPRLTPPKKPEDFIKLKGKHLNSPVFVENSTDQELMQAHIERLRSFGVLLPHNGRKFSRDELKAIYDCFAPEDIQRLHKEKESRNEGALITLFVPEKIKLMIAEQKASKAL